MYQFGLVVTFVTIVVVVTLEGRFAMTDMAGGWSNSLVGTVMSYALGVNDSERQALAIAREKLADDRAEKKSIRKTDLEFKHVELLQLYKTLQLSDEQTKEMSARFDKRIKDEA